MKTKNGFSAYEEIQKLAIEVFGHGVSVQASIFGDDYIILNGSVELLQGKTADIRAKLESLKNGVVS